MDAYCAKTQVNHEELKAAMKASHERIEALMIVSLEVMEACLEKEKEPTSMEMKSVAVHEEVPKEDAAAKTGRALNKQHGDQNLALGAVESCGSQKKLAAACRGMTHHAGVAWCKGHTGKMLHQEPRKDERTRRDIG
jgi:hypothetical protein